MSFVDGLAWEKEERQWAEQREKAALAAVIVTYIEETSPPPHVVQALNKLFELTDTTPEKK